MDEFRLITLDPGHFHAGLIQKEMYDGVAIRVAVYAPLTPDLTEHLNRDNGLTAAHFGRFPGQAGGTATLLPRFEPGGSTAQHC